MKFKREHRYMLHRLQIVISDTATKIINRSVIIIIIAIFSLRNWIFFRYIKHIFVEIDHIQHFCLTVVFRDCLRGVFCSPDFFKNISEMVAFINIYFRRPPLYYFSAVILNFFVNNMLLTVRYLLPLIFFIVAIFSSQLALV